MRRTFTIRKGILLVVSIPLVFNLIFLGVLWGLLGEAQGAIQQQLKANSILLHINKYTQELLNTVSAVSMMVLRHDMGDITETRNRARLELDQLKELLSDEPSDRELFTKIYHIGGRLEAVLYDSMRLAQDGDFPAAGRVAVSGNSTYRQLVGLLKELEISQDKIAQQRNEEKARTQNLVALCLILGLGANLLLAVLISLLAHRYMADRITLIKDNAMRLSAHKKLNPVLTGDDEFAELDRVFHQMANVIDLANLKERMIIDNVNDVICTIDAERRLADVSPSSLVLLGYTPEDMQGLLYVNLLSPDCKNKVTTSIDNAMSGGTAESFEARLVKKGGGTVDTLWSITWSGRDNLLFAIIHDITERKEQEELLKTSEERARRVFENLPIGLAIISETGVIELVNSSSEQMFGYSGKMLNDQPVAALIQSLKAGSAIREIVTSSPGEQVKAKGRRSNGVEFPVEISLTPYRTGSGERLVLTIVDVSERERIEQLKKDFVAMVSHDLRSPLTAIRGFLKLLSIGAFGELSEKGKGSVGKVSKSAERLIALINDLLDMDKLESGQMEIEKGPVKLADLLEDSLAAIANMAEESEVRLEVQPTTIRLEADGARVVQVLVNLLSNAIKFSPEGSTVTVSASQTEGNVKVKITDRGSGIPEAYRSQIFERFRQVPGSSTKYKGTGLGLAICKAIIEQHGGTIGVDSEVGTGSTFWFVLPEADQVK